MKERYQTVIITLSDGRIGTFIGQVLVEKEEAGLTITKVDFTEPVELPDGYNFSIMEND